jgi:GDP-L-fucose synthase
MQAPIYDLAGKRVWVAGHRGMVGSALVRRLQGEGCHIITVGREKVDLRCQADVNAWMKGERVDAIFLAAATVGGIHANDSRPAEFLYDNIAIETNIIEGARLHGVEKLLFLGSSCIYPRLAPQPIREDALLTGPLEPTNQWYAIAKIAGIMLCLAYRKQYRCDFISAMPTNVFGPADNFDLESSHVVPALIAKAHAAKAAGSADIVVWGSGTPLREFVYVDDLADALVFLMKHYSGDEHVNIGVGEDITIRELAETIVRVVGVEGQLRFDAEMPDGTPRKFLDSNKLLDMGWKPKTNLEEGLRRSYAWYLENIETVRGRSRT